MQGSIDGKQCEMVDIDAERTFVREGLFEKELLKHPNPLCGPTGKLSPLWGPMKVIIKIGG